MTTTTQKRWGITLPELFIIIFVMILIFQSGVFQEVWDWIWNVATGAIIFAGLVVWAVIERIRGPRLIDVDDEEDDWEC